MKLMKVLLIFVGLFTLWAGLASAEPDESDDDSVLPTLWPSMWDPCGNNDENGKDNAGDNGLAGGGGGSGNRCDPNAYRPQLLIKEETAQGGSQYLAAGGVEPYRWSISPCGTIDALTGVVTSLEGCCNSVTVTVTDACTTSTSKDIAVPASPLTITGPEAVTDESQYAVSGGTQPFSWEISCGTIDSTGSIISVEGCCGSGSVIVTDTCGQEKRKTVRYPSGEWVLIENTYGSPSYFDFATDPNGSCTYGVWFESNSCSSKTIEAVNDNFRFTDIWAQVYKRTYADKPCIGSCNVPSHTTLEPCTLIPGYNFTCVQYYKKEEWKCSSN